MSLLLLAAVPSPTTPCLRFNNHLKKKGLPVLRAPRLLQDSQQPSSGGDGGATLHSGAHHELIFTPHWHVQDEQQHARAFLAPPSLSAPGPWDIAAHDGAHGSATCSIGFDVPQTPVGGEAMRLAAALSTPLPQHLQMPAPTSTADIVQGIPIVEPQAPPPSEASARIIGGSNDGSANNNSNVFAQYLSALTTSPPYHHFE